MDKIHEVHDDYIAIVIQNARTAAENGNFPQACCLVHNNKIISRSMDQRKSSGSMLARAELLLLNDCPGYIYDFGMDCSFYSVLEPHYSVLPILVDCGLKSFYFSIYQPQNSPADFIDNVEFFRKKIHHYSSGFLQKKAMKLLSSFNDEL